MTLLLIPSAPREELEAEVVPQSTAPLDVVTGRVPHEPQRGIRDRPRRRAPRAVACGEVRPGPSSIRLTTRGRVVVSLLWVVIVAAAVLGVVRPWSEPVSDQPAELVVVEPGDTLWGLAGRAAPTVDPRATVDRIVEVNRLASTGDIQPGDRLLVPAG